MYVKIAQLGHRMPRQMRADWLGHQGAKPLRREEKFARLSQQNEPISMQHVTSFALSDSQGLSHSLPNRVPETQNCPPWS
jgi:hypothetical protein